MSAIDPNRIRALAERLGTPLYLYDEGVILSRFRELRKALSRVKADLYYAVKANSTLAILQLLTNEGAGFDIVSGGELARVEAAGGRAENVVFSGVGKSEAELVYAMQRGVHCINIESRAELIALKRIVQRLGRRPRIAFRVNPNIEAGGHTYISTGLKSAKFGMEPAEALALYRDEVSRAGEVAFIGLDCHIGSQITEIAPLKAAYIAVKQLVAQFEAEGAKITHLDLGGGFGIPYSGKYESFPLDQFSDMITELFLEAPYRIAFEPGRFIVGEAGTLVTRVLYRKKHGDKQFLVVDAGMNDLIRPSLYQAFHQIEPLSGGGAESEKVDIVGPVCESGCFLAKDRMLARVEEGELLLVRDAGAYGAAMSSNYNSRPRPAEVLLRSDGSDALVRRREEVGDLWRNEFLL